jgi:hypothetical protein
MKTLSQLKEEALKSFREEFSDSKYAQARADQFEAFLSRHLTLVAEGMKEAVLPSEFVIPVSPLDPTFYMEVPRKIGHDGCRTEVSTRIQKFLI